MGGQSVNSDKTTRVTVPAVDVTWHNQIDVWPADVESPESSSVWHVIVTVTERRRRACGPRWIPCEVGPVGAEITKIALCVLLIYQMCHGFAEKE